MLNARVNRKYLVPIIHLTTWSGIFFYPFLFHYIPIDDIKSVTRIALFLLLLIGLFYFNSFVLVPRLLKRKRILWYFLSATLSIVFVSTLAGYLQVIFNPDYFTRPGLFERSFNTGIVTGLIAWIISTGIKVTSEWLANQQLMKAIENEKLNTELNFLRSQVNPHFLFNALNNIYSLETKKSPDTGPAILKLSELIRYMLYETSSDFVTLEKEINYLKTYIDLQKLGISKNMPIVFKVEGDFSEKKIRPMLLIPLIENVFKHGISYENPAPLSITITVAGDVLKLHTENFVGVSGKSEQHNGIGLTNLRKRLNLLYPGLHQLNIFTDNNKFIADLSIHLQ